MTRRRFLRTSAVLAASATLLPADLRRAWSAESIDMSIGCCGAVAAAARVDGRLLLLLHDGNRWGLAEGDARAAAVGRITVLSLPEGFVPWDMAPVADQLVLVGGNVYEVSRETVDGRVSQIPEAERRWLPPDHVDGTENLVVTSVRPVLLPLSKRLRPGSLRPVPGVSLPFAAATSIVAEAGEVAVGVAGSQAVEDQSMVGAWVATTGEAFAGGSVELAYDGVVEGDGVSLMRIGGRLLASTTQTSGPVITAVRQTDDWAVAQLDVPGKAHMPVAPGAAIVIDQGQCLSVGLTSRRDVSASGRARAVVPVRGSQDVLVVGEAGLSLVTVEELA